MGKSSTSFYIKDEFIDRMEEQNINKSSLVNDLLRQYFEGESHVDMAVREIRRERIKAEQRALKKQLELTEEELEVLDEKESKYKQAYTRSLEELVENVKNGGRVWSDHQRVKEIATEHGKEPTEVIEAVREECPNAHPDQFQQP